MMPTWVAVVTGISLAILALAAIVIAAASVVAALGVRGFLRMLHELAGPAVGGVRALVATIRAEAEGLAGTSRELRQRIVRAAGAAGGPPPPPGARFGGGPGGGGGAGGGGAGPPA